MSVYTNQSGFAARLFLTEQGTGIGIAKGIYARPPAGVHANRLRQIGYRRTNAGTQ